MMNQELLRRQSGRKMFVTNKIKVGEKGCPAGKLKIPTHLSKEKEFLNLTEISAINTFKKGVTREIIYEIILSRVIQLPEQKRHLKIMGLERAYSVGLVQDLIMRRTTHKIIRGIIG